MNLFQMKSNPAGTERIGEFLEDNFVSIGPEELPEDMNLFVQAMQDGDYVLVAAQDCVHLGDLGDYFYDDSAASREKGLCHRRGVTWLAAIPRAELNAELQELLARPESVSRFNYPLHRAQLYRWSSNLAGEAQAAGKSVHVDEDTITEALEILKAALQSSDEERRERAAAAILLYAK